MTPFLTQNSSRQHDLMLAFRPSAADQPDQAYAE